MNVTLDLFTTNVSMVNFLDIVSIILLDFQFDKGIIMSSNVFFCLQNGHRVFLISW